MRHTLFIALLMGLPITMHSQILKPEEQHIPGHYEYVHSWDYAAPDGNGTIHCDETGTLDFYADGTFADTAVQSHRMRMKTPVKTVLGWLSPDTAEIDRYGFNYMYYCQGQWRVEDGKFLFAEHAEGFHMDLLDQSVNDWIIYYANLIEKKTLPNSSRWFTFDIERLDDEWFIWTYTYPNGRKDSWEMKRVR